MEEGSPWEIQCSGLTDQFGRFGDEVSSSKPSLPAWCIPREVASGGYQRVEAGHSRIVCIKLLTVVLTQHSRKEHSVLRLIVLY